MLRFLRDVGCVEPDDGLHAVGHVEELDGGVDGVIAVCAGVVGGGVAGERLGVFGCEGNLILVRVDLVCLVCAGCVGEEMWSVARSVDFGGLEESILGHHFQHDRTLVVEKLDHLTRSLIRHVRNIPNS